MDMTASMVAQKKVKMLKILFYAHSFVASQP